MNQRRIQWRLTRLEQRAALISAPVPAPQPRRWDLACFTDEDLERMVPLAQKADAMRQEVVWTVAELALLDQLDQAYQERCPSAA